MLEIPSPEMFQTIVDCVEVGVYAIDFEQKISYWNYGAGKITGFKSQEVLGRTCGDSILVEYENDNPVLCTHANVLEGTRDGVPKEAIAYVRHRAGHVVPVRLWSLPFTNRAGNVVGAVKIFSEKLAVPELSREEASSGLPAELDVESGVRNRASVERYLMEQIQTCGQQGRPLGVIGVQMVKFESFRQAHGKEAGTALVPEVARTLKDLMRRSDVLGRWAGNSFLAVLPGCGIEPLQRVAERMKAVASRVAIPWWGDRLSIEIATQATIVELGDTLESVEGKLSGSGQRVEEGKGAGA